MSNEGEPRNDNDLTPREKLLTSIAADLLETVRLCYRFPGSAKAGGAARQTLQQYGILNAKGMFVKEPDGEIDCYKVIESYGDNKKNGQEKST